MSTPLDQQQPPPTEVNQQAYTANTGHGSVGSVIAVLAVITILGIIAGVIGRLCSGRRIMGHGQYDFEGWIERKCSSCLDGRIDPLSTRPAYIPTAEPVEEVEGSKEIKAEEQEQVKHKSHASTSES